MFNFKELKLDKREDSENTSSFVGIRRNKNNELEFRLPKGFENFPEGDFDATKQLFFKMYRTFKKFENDKTRLPIDERPAGKDNIETMGNAYRFMDKEDNEVLLYSKISVIENLLEAYQDLALDVIERRVGRNEKIDYSKIDQYLHKAIYLDKDVIYLDEMELPRHVLRYESATIIDLFCFILHELENELEQELDERVKDLANRFKEQHLSYDQSLFNEETFDGTIATLKDVLDDIDKMTAYKDENYWQLYEAIECFLYGELDMQNTHDDGIFWGIQDFWSIWEDMCNTYAFDKWDSEIVYADTNIIFNSKRIKSGSQKNSFKNPFFMEFRGEKRWMRPDLIYFIGKNKVLFDDNSIEIEIKRSHSNGRIDFRINLKDKNTPLIKKIYESFCENLKATLNINNGKTFGARASESNSFRNYPKNILEKEKLHIIETHKKLNPTQFVILDWKYMDEKKFKTKDNKIDIDISKQLCYDFCLKESVIDKVIESQFVIPSYEKPKDSYEKRKDIGDFIEDEELYSRLQENDIKVFKANFQLIQEVYLNHD